MPLYSFGLKSPIKFSLTDEFAERVNRAIDALRRADAERKKQIESKKIPWYLLQVDWQEKSDRVALETFLCDLHNARHEYGEEAYLNAYMGDYLVCNVLTPFGPPRTPASQLLSEVIRW